MVTATKEQKGAEQVGLFLDGVLIDLKISFWRGKKPLSPEDLGVSRDDVPDIFTLGRKLVVPKEAMSRFGRIEARANYLTEQFTFPFPTGHSRFIPYSVLPEVMAELRELQDRFTKEVDNFLANYDMYRKEMIERYPEHKEALSRGVMSVGELRKRFHFLFILYEVSLPRNIRYRAVEARDALADAEARRRALEQAEEEYRRQFQTQIDEFLASSIGGLREAVGNAVVSLSERIKKGDAITKGSLDSLRRTIERFKTLNFAGDNEVEGKLKELEALIPKEGRAFVDTQVREAFATALDSVRGTLIESDISGVTGEYRRKVRL